MPEYLHPGVYVEETSYRGKPIQGVGTSTAGFVGAALKGPEGRPTLVTSLNQFKRTFGDPISPPTNLGEYLGHSVKAFFENGGMRGYVVRVLAADAAASLVAVEQGAVLRLSSGATVRGPNRTISVNTLRTVEVGSVLRAFTRPSTAAPFTETRTLQVESYDALRNRITVIAADEIPIGVVLEPDNTYFYITGTPPHGVAGSGTGPTFEARSRGAGGDRISIHIRPTDLPPVAFRTTRALRDRPQLDSLAGPVADGTVDLELSIAALRRLRAGDQIAVGTAEPLTVASVDAAEVSFNIVPGGSVADYSAGGGEILLVNRGGAALAAPVSLGAIPPGVLDLTVGAPSPEGGFPHVVAAFLQAGDVVRLQNGPNSDDLDITQVRLAQEVAAGAHVHLVPGTPVSPAQPGPGIVVRLLRTGDANPDLARLMVGDASVFTAPFRTGSPESIAISDGTSYDASRILLVDPATNTLLVEKTNPPVAGQFADAVTVDNWLSVESLQVAADGQATVAVASTSSFYGGGKVELDTGAHKHECTVASVDSGARTVTFTAGLALGAGNYVDLPANPVDRRGYLRTAEIEVQVLERAQDRDVLKEIFSGLSWNGDPAAASSRRYFVARINDDEIGSKLVRVTTVPAGTGLDNQPTTRSGQPLALINGSDGSPLAAVDLIGRDNGPGSRTGIEALVERDDIAIVAVPGVTNESVQGALISHCERIKYRFAVLDGKIGTPLVTDIQAHRNNYDSKYAAYYAPWLQTLDLNTGRLMVAPPSGYVVGIYARSDANVGVHKAPANEVVRNVSDVEFPFTAGEQDVLNPVGVNLIRDLTPRGIRVWGARTISSDQEWKYVNVRRLFIFLEHSIDIGTQWVVFEPNSESLWARVTETITSFLIGVWKSGALMGTTPEEAFFVRCDRTTMTQDDLDNGRLICEIGVAPVMPAEFVIFRIGQFTANATS